MERKEGGSDFYFDVRPIDPNIVATYAAGGGRAEHLAGRNIKHRAVPWTGDFVACDFALAKRSAHVRTGIVDGVKGAAHIKDGDLFTINFHHARLTGWYVFSLSNFLELGHDSILLAATASTQPCQCFFSLRCRRGPRRFDRKGKHDRRVVESSLHG